MLFFYFYPLGLPVRGNVPGQAGDIPGPPGIFPPETGNVPLTPLSSDPSGISPAGGDIPGPHWEYPRPAGIFPARPIGNIARGHYHELAALKVISGG